MPLMSWLLVCVLLHFFIFYLEIWQVWSGTSVSSKLPPAVPNLVRHALRHPLHWESPWEPALLSALVFFSGAWRCLRCCKSPSWESTCWPHFLLLFPSWPCQSRLSFLVWELPWESGFLHALLMPGHLKKCFLSCCPNVATTSRHLPHTKLHQ